MKAKLFTYSTEKLTPTQRSMLSKKINGYRDKSNKARYIYQRKGIIKQLKHIKVTNKTFIVMEKDFTFVSKVIRKHKATIKSWNIEIKTL